MGSVLGVRPATRPTLVLPIPVVASRVGPNGGRRTRLCGEERLGRAQFSYKPDRRRFREDVAVCELPSHGLRDLCTGLRLLSGDPIIVEQARPHGGWKRWEWSCRPQQTKVLQRVDGISEWLSDQAGYAPCPAWRKESVSPCPEPERNGRAGMTRSSGGPGLMADTRHPVRCHIDRLIDLDSEAGFVNCVVC